MELRSIKLKSSRGSSISRNGLVYIGLAKKFTWVLLCHLVEKPELTFWPTQYIIAYHPNVFLLRFIDIELVDIEISTVHSLESCIKLYHDLVLRSFFTLYLTRGVSYLLNAYKSGKSEKSFFIL